MNAFDKLMRAVAAAIAKGRRAPQIAPKNRKTRRVATSERRNIRERKSEKRTNRIQPRVVSAQAGHTSRKAYNPPRAPEPDRSALTEAFAPAPTPTPPEVPGPISAPLYVPPQLEPTQPVSTRVADQAHAGEITTEAHPRLTLAQVIEKHRPSVNFSGLTIDAAGNAHHRAGTILPNGEILDD